MGITVEKVNDVMSVKITSEYKKPWWLDTMYYGRYTEQEDGTLVIPCRTCNVTITKPIVMKTPMGMAQSSKTYVENWTYFDVPQLSLLVDEGCNLLDTWSITDLHLEMKTEITDETKENEIKSGEENVS